MSWIDILGKVLPIVVDIIGKATGQEPKGVRAMPPSKIAADLKSIAASLESADFKA